MSTNESPADLYLKSVGRTPGWQGFTYISERHNCQDVANDIAKDRADMQSLSEYVAVGTALDSGILSLSTAEIGDRLRIVALNCGGANSRLLGMGLMPGAEFDVISSTPNGSVIISLNNHRLGLGAEMAECIQVASVVAPQIRPTQSSNHSMRNSSMSSTNETVLVRLRDAAVGSRLRVVGYDPTARDYKRKLLAMGLTPGAEFLVTRHAPLGDPTQIQVRGFNLSLRKDEADALQVELVSSPDGGATA